MNDSDAPVTRRDTGEWDGPSVTRELVKYDGSSQGGVLAWLGARVDQMAARMLDLFASQPPTADGEPVALTRTGGPIARWISFPRGVKVATAATSGAAAALAACGVLAMAGSDFGVAMAAAAAATGLSAASGPLGLRLAARLHRLIARRRRYTIAELRGVPDRRAVAVRGVVIARRTAACALTGRPAVWSLTRFRKGAWVASDFFHESAYDFLLDDGTDEPIWIEVSGGMLLDRFPADQRFQFHSTTLLDVDHPFFTRLRLDDREVLASEMDIAAGDVVEVVGRLGRRLDPTAPSETGRDFPQRRALRSGMRVPVMVRKVREPDLALSRVRRLLPKGPPDASPGEPPIRRF